MNKKDELLAIGIVCAACFAMALTPILARRFGSEGLRLRMDRMEVSLRAVQGTPRGVKIAVLTIGLFVVFSLVVIWALPNARSR